MPRFFYPLLALSQLLAVILLVLTGYWTGHLLGGFAWDGSEQQFNLHPLLMILGLVFLHGDAILMFRIFRKENKTVVKVIHLVMHVATLICIVIALKATFSYHRHAGYANLYSAHSWIGLLTVLLFFMQWVGGFVSFFLPWLNSDKRAELLPFHRFFGIAIFTMACTTSLIGLNEKLFCELSSDYSKMGTLATVGNLLAMVLVAFALVVGFLVTYPPYQRTSVPDIEKLPLTQAASMRDFQSTDDDRVLEE
ncbi:transmembrane ascorbate-dependent reductase CYB561-like [Apostichopus japonicus]